jgi:hypothetical protein
MHWQLGDVLAIELDAPAVAGHKTDDHVEGRGLAGALSMAIDMSKADINARITTDRKTLAPALEQAALT